MLDGAAAAVAGPLLQETPQQHKTQQHHRLVEEAGPARRRPEQPQPAGQIGTGHPQAHQGVHAGQPLERPDGAAPEDLTTRQGQGEAGHQGVEGLLRQQAGKGGRGQLPRHGQMAQTRHQQQGQGHQQLAPLLPPVALPQPLPAGGRRLLGIANPGDKTEPSQGLRQGLRRGLSRGMTAGVGGGGIELHPGGAADQVDARLADAGLGQQLLLDGPEAAAALHPFYIEQQHRWRG